MDWIVVVSAFTGTLVCIIGVIVAFLVWDYFDRQKSAKATLVESEKPKSLQDDILERHLEELVVDNFSQLFPGWTIYSTETNGNDDIKPIGIRYRTLAGEIDILCIDEENNFVVIELKRNRASDTVVAQLDRYLAWVEQNLAQPGQRVRGIIIAKKHGEHLKYSASRKDDIELWTYDLKLTLVPKIAGRQVSAKYLDSTHQNYGILEASSE